jgi:hypothetical protein
MQGNARRYLVPACSPASCPRLAHERARRNGVILDLRPAKSRAPHRTNGYRVIAQRSRTRWRAADEDAGRAHSSQARGVPRMPKPSTTHKHTGLDNSCNKR